MPTRAEVLSDIASKITDKTAVGSLTNTDDGANRVLILDYIDQQAPIKTSGLAPLTATPSELPFYFNSITGSNGIAYLPATTMIGKEVIVMCVSATNTTIRANAANENKMITTPGTNVASIIINNNQIYRFTYVGFGSGSGGTVDGFWKSEQM